MSRIAFVVAVSRNGVIGRDGGLPWHISTDLKRFKAITMGKPLIMGRKTWDSLPPRFRPLPGRANLVITRQEGWHAQGAQTFAGLQQALEFCKEFADVWVIGGAQLFAQAPPLADTAVVTEIDAEFEGDAYAPQFGPRWTEVAREAHVSSTGLRFSFVTYHRLKGN